ncbi:MAG TPA: UbiA family prenyltransferase [Candidatus Saccharimonadales bacterium]|nr:UbiA family prenyltransferase [Candidatus Saccharimonadales bacterium]
MSMPKSDRLRRWLGYLLLLHPGPSAVCTLVTAVSGWSAWRQTLPKDRPTGSWARRLAAASAAMALAQMSTGVLNDAFDAPWDRIHQSYKPIAAGSVPRRRAWLIGIAFGFASVALASRAGSRALRLMLLGLASGWAYSLGLSRTPASFLPFASGLATVPLLGPAAVRVRAPAQGQVAVMAAGLGVGLHLANGGPDIERDRLAGRRSLPVLLGDRGSRRASHLLLGAGAVAVALSAPRSGRAWAWAGSGLAAALVLADWLAPRSVRSRGEHPFVVPTLAGGAVAGAWLLGRARGAPS